jgi:hypothetical protein
VFLCISAGVLPRFLLLLSAKLPTNLVNSNNQDYARIDKSKGEDFLFITATAAAAAYAAFVGDGDPVDGLETIGQGNDPLTKVIGQGAQAAIVKCLSFFNALYNLASSPSRHNHR